MAPSSPMDSWRWHSEAGEQQFIYWACISLMGMFVLAFVALLSGVNAPYGRYGEAEGKQNVIMAALSSCKLNAKVAWVAQECPTLIALALCLITAEPECLASPGNLLVLGCFAVHYVNRSFIYPLRMKGGKPVPLPVMFMAMAFCTANGYVQCRSLTRFLIVPLSAPSTLLGAAVWAAGLYSNLDADYILRNLRKPGETGYKIPYGGLFNYVSGANFCSEIIEWVGYALAMGCAVPGVMFAFCTFCNIGPRAVAHHKWYLGKFKDDYPKERKALIPFIY